MSRPDVSLKTIKTTFGGLGLGLGFVAPGLGLP